MKIGQVKLKRLRLATDWLEFGTKIPLKMTMSHYNS